MPVIERERKWTAATAPRDLPEGSRIRQGYLGIRDDRSLRVRQKGDRHLGTIKIGTPPSRTEVEWEFTADQFEALWPHTAGARVEKVRSEVPLDDHPGGTGLVAEVDVFEGDLEGLVLIEVEFESDDAMAAFEPPPWFGTEVTDHDGYGNASLATHGIPADHHTRT